MLYVNYITIKEKNNKLSYKKSLLAHWGERFRKIRVLLSLTLSNQQHTSTTSRANTTVQSTRQQVFIWHLCVYSKVDLVTLRKKSQVIIKDMAKAISDLFRALKRMKGNKTLRRVLKTISSCSNLIYFTLISALNGLFSLKPLNPQNRGLPIKKKKSQEVQVVTKCYLCPHL